MAINYGKFLHTQTGRLVMSILLGFGLASLFRSICKDKDCLLFRAPPLEEIKDKIYKNAGKCVKYSPVPAKCSANAGKIIEFE